MATMAVQVRKTKPELPYDMWMDALLMDAVRLKKDKILAMLPEFVLEMFWADGTPPTIAAIAAYSDVNQKLAS